VDQLNLGKQKLQNKTILYISKYTRCTERLMINSQGVATEDRQWISGSKNITKQWCQVIAASQRSWE